MGVKVAVAGGSGYAGGELLRLLAGHPDFEIQSATAHSQAGEPVGAVHPHLWSLGLTFAATDPETLAEADLVFLALPHGQSAALAATLPERVKVVDLGADHRLRDAAAWQRYYGGPFAAAVDIRPARTSRPAGADRGGEPGRRDGVLCGGRHARARSVGRCRHRQPRRRGGGRLLRYHRGWPGRSSRTCSPARSPATCRPTRPARTSTWLRSNRPAVPARCP